MSCRHDLALGTCRRCYPETGTIDPGPEESYKPNLEGPGAVMAEIDGAWEGLCEFIADPQNHHPPTILFTSHREEKIGSPTVEELREENRHRTIKRRLQIQGEPLAPPWRPGELVGLVRRRLGTSEDRPEGEIGPKTTEQGYVVHVTQGQGDVIEGVFPSLEAALNYISAHKSEASFGIKYPDGHWHDWEKKP